MGGSRNYPKIIGESTYSGIVIGKWLYYSTSSLSKVYKLNTEAIKIISFEKFISLEELMDKHQEIQTDKEYYDYLIKEKIN